MFSDVLRVRKVKIPLPTGKSIYLSNVFFAPAMRRSVIFVSQLALNGLEVKFRKNKVTIGMRVEVLVFGSLHEKLYLLNTIDNGIKSIFDYSMCVCVLCMDGLGILWHMRLCHINKNRINRMVKDGLLRNLGKVELEV